MATPPNPGHIKVRIKRGTVHSHWIWPPPPNDSPRAPRWAARLARPATPQIAAAMTGVAGVGAGGGGAERHPFGGVEAADGGDHGVGGRVDYRHRGAAVVGDVGVAGVGAGGGGVERHRVRERKPPMVVTTVLVVGLITDTVPVPWRSAT